MGMAMLGLSGLLGSEGLLAAPAAAADRMISPLAPKSPHFPAKAKRVIHLFMNGGPSHVDTFDPKPLLAKYAGKPLPAENLRTERKTGAAMPSPFQFQNTARAASRSVTSSPTSARALTTSPSSAPCMRTCRTTSPRCCS